MQRLNKDKKWGMGDGIWGTLLLKDRIGSFTFRQAGLKQKGFAVADKR
ncbi:MAG: hypothetical protein ACYDA4_00060 [Ignavibacteriaceae bacterium]